MIERVDVVSYGSAAAAALDATIALAQTGRPLAPVTVVVPSNLAGLAARRRLGAAGGVANVTFLTLRELAHRLGADRLLDRPPAGSPVLLAAVRATLRETPGPLAAVRDHVATETTVAALIRELAELDPTELDRLARDGSRAAHDAVALHREVARRLDEHHTEPDLARAAAARPDLARATAVLGHVVWFLPQPAPATTIELIRVVLAQAPSTVVVGLGGDPAADEPVLAVCRRADVDVPTTAAAPAPTASGIVSATDPDDEVRAVVRRVLALAEAGVALDRIGVFHPAPEPYVGLLHQHLTAAGIPANGPSRRRLHESVAGRTLLAALSLPAERWRRERVMALVSGAPVRRFDGGPALPTAWETLSREAGVVAGHHDWRTKLGAHRIRLTHRTPLPVGPGVEGEPSWEERAAAENVRALTDLGLLATFVDDLVATVDEVRAAPTWAERSEATQRLLLALLGPDHRHVGWPDAERVSFQRVEDVLARLRGLDAIEPTAELDVFVRALRAELDVPQGRLGRYGHGVLFGPIESAVGHDLDAVFVLGGVEGLLPAMRRGDLLLPDADRALTDGALPPRSARLHHQHRAFLTALAAAPPERRCVTLARSDLRSNRTTSPSRWLLDSASALAGHTVHSTDFADLRTPGLDVVASFADGVLHAPSPVTLVDRDLADISRLVAAGVDPRSHPGGVLVARGLDAQDARRSAQFTEWDGNLAGMPIERAGDRPWSPTRLERWAVCGLRYAFVHVLGLADRDDPERLVDLDPLDRGSALHRVLELFVADAIGPDAPPPDRPWSEADAHRLLEIATEVFDDYERRGRTGRPLHWDLTSAQLMETLLAFLDQDDTHRATTRSHPIEVEFRFGRDPVPPVVLDLPSGRTVAFSGSADRIDAGVDDPGRLVVSDYKSGKGDRYRALEQDPVLAGTTLQLGIYAEAAHQLLGATSVRSQYWIVHPDPRARQLIGYEWTDERRERFGEVLAAIVDGIDGGVFPAVPGDWDTYRNTHANCSYCEFDRVCPRDRGEQFAAKSTSVELRVRAPLAPVP